MGGGQPSSLTTFEGLLNADALQKQGQWWQQQLLGIKPQQTPQIPQSMMIPNYTTQAWQAADPTSAYDLATPPSSLDPYAFPQPDTFGF